MTNFDNIVGVGSFEVSFGGYRFEIKANTTFGDVVDEMKEMAEFLLENGEKGLHLLRAADYFGIPEDFAREIWSEASKEYRMYA